MPRIRKTLEPNPRPTAGTLVDRLADELRSNRDNGQPIILEQSFASGRIRTIVIWDEWDGIGISDRTPVILHAYQKAGVLGKGEEIALASGLTVPEAHAAGFLPYEIIAGLRRSDRVTQEECREAMLDEGASALMDKDKPRLRLATEDAAEAARKRLASRLPGSEEIWIVTQDVTQDPGFTELMDTHRS